MMNTKDPILLSIIVPIYRIEEQYLKECLYSIHRIKAKKIEIILIDDGSPDNCGDICDNFVKEDERFICYHKVNEGVSAARNYGIDHAIGEWITFIDGDDWVDSEKIDKLIEKLKLSNAEIVYFGEYINYYNQAPIEIKPFFRTRFFTDKDDINRLKRMVFVRDFESMKTNYGAGVIVNTACKFIRRSLLIDKQIKFDPKVAVHEDALFNLELLSNCKRAEYIDICAYHYRMRNSSTCHSKLGNDYGEIRKFYDLIEKFLLRYPQDKKFIDAANYRYYDLIFENFFSVNKLADTSLREIVAESAKFQKEISMMPLNDAIKKVKLKNYPFKGKVKLLFLKWHLGRALFILIMVKERFKKKKNRGKMF